MRKGQAKRRIIAPDAIYNSVFVSNLINRIMKSGKKRLAERIVYEALDLLKKRNLDPIEVLETALKNVRPSIKIRSKKVGGARYQIPTKLSEERATTLALRWIIISAQERKKNTMQERLMAELEAAFKKEGGAMKKREAVHKMAEANRAFAYYSW